MNDGADDSDLIIPGQTEPPEPGYADGSYPEPACAGESHGDEHHRYEHHGYEHHGEHSYAGDSYARDAYGALAVQLEEDDVLLLDAYSEDDNAVTQEVAGLLSEPRWLVQFTALDRRMMDTSDVISALLSGAIRRETLVWRGGMDDWAPVGRLDLLAASAIPTQPPQRRSVASSGAAPASSIGALSGSPSVRARPLELTLASVAIALSAATITTSFLSIAGVFDAHRGGAPTHVQALRAEPASERPDPRAPDRTREEPAPPDPERATAVAH